MNNGKTVLDLVREMESGQRIRLSIEGWINTEGEQKWSSALTDAQIMAYAEKIISHARIEDGTWYCIVKAEQVAEG